MSVGTALVAIKTANSTLNALIGTGFSPDKLPQKAPAQAWAAYLPKVRFQVISGLKDDAMTPAIVNHRHRVQMDGYALTAADRTALRDAMIGAFYGYAGTIGGETVRSILIDNEWEGLEMLDTNTESYRVSIDFRVDLA